jgi:uncharacterized protein
VVVLALGLLACSDKGSDTKPAGGQAAGPDGGRALPAVAFAGGQARTATLAVEVADDGNEMQCGLMHRTSLPDDQGMIFIYGEDSSGGFWMRNTLIPLSIAYVAADGRIVDILDMRPVPEPKMTPFRMPDGTEVNVKDGDRPPDGATWVTYPPRGPYRYAIEANQGWFGRHGIAVGDRADVSKATQGRDAAAPPPICAERGP